ncbi:MAG: RNA-binding protein [Rhodospirillales bacterium]|nr:RNA-binding protein [Rhodospirillales bacterium]
MKLIVLNLPRDFSEDALAKLFKSHGNIKACNLVIDAETGTSKGFGFVEMALEHEAVAAIEELHGSKISKNKIRVKPADERLTPASE